MTWVAKMARMGKYLCCDIVTRNREGHLLMIKWSIREEDRTILNFKIYKAKVEEIKGKIKQATK